MTERGRRQAVIGGRSKTGADFPDGPLGTFEGELPGTGVVLDGLGVMEHHRARS